MWPKRQVCLLDLTQAIHRRARLTIETSSGKSTLFLRMLDPVGGASLIDGQDISRVSHEKLCAALSVVPQEPAILEGSIRTNVDPGDIHSDKEVVSTLKRAGLWGQSRNDSPWKTIRARPVCRADILYTRIYYLVPFYMDPPSSDTLRSDTYKASSSREV
jgi:hypothetical protein